MTSKQIISDQTADDAPTPGIYKHYKGNLYQVLGKARHSETEEWLVVYQALYGEKGFWLRPLNLWLSPVGGDVSGTSSQNVPTVERFALQDSNAISLNELTQHS